MKTAILCFVLCACGGNGMEEVSVAQEHVNPPKESGKIQNPTDNTGGCQSSVVMIDGQLIDVPTACNNAARINEGDPLRDPSDPERFLIKQQER